MKGPYVMNRNPSAKAGGIALAVTLASVIWCSPSQATTFTFGDEWYVNSQTTFNTAFGTGTAGYAGAGVYQETNTITPTVTELHANSSASYQPIPGEFVQNDGNSALLLNGWNHNFSGTLPQRVNNGSTGVTSVNNNLTGNNTNLNFQYLTNASVNASTGVMSGTTTAFNLTSLDFNSNVFAIGLTIEGLVGGPNGTVVDTDPLSVNTGGAWTTYTLNWTGVDTIAIYGTASQGSLSLRNVVLTTVTVPAPLIGHGLLVVLAIGVILFGSRLLERSKKHRSFGIVTQHPAV
jgi:hypothetical protein